MTNPNQQGLASPMAVRAAPSVPTTAPALTSRMFRESQRPSERPKTTNFAAGIAALVVVAAAGYLGAMTGKPKATTPEPVSPEQSEVAKVEPPPPTATEMARHEPPPAPAPVETTPPARAREAPVEPPAPPREVVREPSPSREVVREPSPPREVARESSPSRRTTSDEEPPPRTRASRTHTPRPPTDEESGSTSAPAPETRLPDSNDAPAARPTIDQAALRAAFAEGEAKAKACLGATSPTGTARFSVTFAPTGEAVGAVVSGAPFANTIEGQCMATKFRTLHVPPFTGGEVIVRKSITFN